MFDIFISVRKVAAEDSFIPNYKDNNKEVFHIKINFQFKFLTWILLLQSRL